jgi:hypothetical protein
VSGSQVAACPARGMSEKGQWSARGYASFEDVRTKFIAAIKHTPDLNWAGLRATTRLAPIKHAPGKERFVADSPLEGDGFEPSVPRDRDDLRATAGSESDRVANERRFRSW